MKKTIQTLSTEPKLWTAKDGSYTLAFIEGQFTDGSSFSYGAKPETFEKRLEELQALVGKETDYELEDKGLYQGTQQYKLRNYPGKPQPRNFGGGGMSDEQVEHLALRVAEEVLKHLSPGSAPAPVSEAPVAPTAPAKKATKTPGGANLQQVKQIKELASALSWSEARLFETAGVSDSLMELTKEDANELVGVLTAATLGADA